jgi:small subunit ribosomal protein S17e
LRAMPNAIFEYNYKIPCLITTKVDRINRLVMQVLAKHKDEFTTDFAKNKKVLDQVAIIRSKGLKNEMAGYITKFVKREATSKAQKAEQDAQIEARSEQAKAAQEVDADVEETVDSEDAEDGAEETVEDSTPQEIVVESKAEE